MCSLYQIFYIAKCLALRKRIATPSAKKTESMCEHAYIRRAIACIYANITIEGVCLAGILL